MARDQINPIATSAVHDHSHLPSFGIRNRQKSQRNGIMTMNTLDLSTNQSSQLPDSDTERAAPVPIALVVLANVGIFSSILYSFVSG